MFNLLFLIGAINYWVTAITGKSLIPSDIFIAKTAFGVIAGVQVQTRDILMFAAYIILVIEFNIALNTTPKKATSEKAAGRINSKDITTNLAWLIAMVLFLNQFSPLMYDSVRRLGLPVHLIASAKGYQNPQITTLFLLLCSFPIMVMLMRTAPENHASITEFVPSKKAGLHQASPKR